LCGIIKVIGNGSITDLKKLVWEGAIGSHGEIALLEGRVELEGEEDAE